MISLDRINPEHVTSWSDIETTLIDRSRRLRILSGIAIPDSYVNDDERSYPDTCVVNLHVTVTDFLQATCQVGLATISNDNTAFTFGLNDCSVTADPSGELLLTVDLEARGEKTTLHRFGFQIVVLCGNRVPAVTGQIRWERDLLNTRIPAHGVKNVHTRHIDVPNLVKIHAQVPVPASSGGSGGGAPFGGPLPAEFDLGYAQPAGEIQTDGVDNWVEYSFENPPLGVLMHMVGKDPSPRFGSDVDVGQISGPNPFQLTPTHLYERVDFRISQHRGPA